MSNKVPSESDIDNIISDTCLSISKISDKTIKELKQEIEKIKNNSKLSKIAKDILINEAEIGIDRYERIKSKVKEYCLTK